MADKAFRKNQKLFMDFCKETFTLINVNILP